MLGGATWDQHHDRYEGLYAVFRALAEAREVCPPHGEVCLCKITRRT